ncbi:MAG: hypothetical protein OSJ27_03265 [Candidatus Gastranaerophilales bacterium]|nr:hypothetical protein [Candidatus Gastranaerophilales bacterium]
MIFISLFLTCLSSYFIISTFGSFAYFFPTILGLLILNIEILSLFKQISPFGIIIINLLTLFAAAALWIKKGLRKKDNRIILLKPDFTKLKTGFKRVLNCLKLDRGLIILCLGLFFLLGTGFILSAFLPVNEPDALTYHTYRAFVWAQKGYIHHFDTIDLRNLVMPINSEIIYTWIFSLTGKDFGFGLLQYITFFFTISGLWIFLGRLKFSYRKRLWTIFIFSTFAGVISQISSTQTDLLVGTLLLYSMIFFFDYINGGNNWNKSNALTSSATTTQTRTDIVNCYFSSLAFAVALGVKSTAFIAGAPLLIFFIIYSYKKKALRSFFTYAVFLSANFIIFSSYNYILNFIDYSNPLGSRISINEHGFFGGFKGFFANFVNYNIQLLDTTGFKWGIFISKFIFQGRDALFAFLNIPNNLGVLSEMESVNSFLKEQTMGYGITSILAFFPSVFAAIFLLLKAGYNKIFKNQKTKEGRIILYSLGALFYINLIFLSFSIGYMVYSIRFICTFIILSAPVLIFSYFKKNNFYKTVIILFAIFYLFFASVYLSFRPFKRLVQSYKNEPVKEEFFHNVRCMNYEYFKREKKSCEIDENIFNYIEKYKTVGIFPDKNIMMQLSEINAAKKHIRLEQMIISRIEKYNLEKYDYLITPYPFQTINEFNNKDKRKLTKTDLLNQNCLYIKNENGKTTVIENQNELDKLIEIKCLTPENYIKEKGFAPTHEIKTRWISLINNREIVSSFIIWKNLKY